MCFILLRLASSDAFMGTKHDSCCQDQAACPIGPQTPHPVKLLSIIIS